LNFDAKTVRSNNGKKSGFFESRFLAIRDLLFRELSTDGGAPHFGSNVLLTTIKPPQNGPPVTGTPKE
jgi:hypothetical protein